MYSASNMYSVSNMYYATPLRPTAHPFVPGHSRVDVIQQHLNLVEYCCAALEPEKEDEGIASFLEGCKRRIELYPTLNELQALIASKPMREYRLEDHNPQLDLAIRYMCGWETHGHPDYFAALGVLSHITTPGRWTKQRFRGSITLSPSKDTAGRAFALAAWAYHNLSLQPDDAYYQRYQLPSMPRTGYNGPPQRAWQLHLYAVAHAADAARVKMVSPAVLAVGYYFRRHANILRCLVKSGYEYFVPLMLALRHNRQGIYFHQEVVYALQLQGENDDIKMPLDAWLCAMYKEYEDHPCPYWDGKLLPYMHYYKINGETNE